MVAVFEIPCHHFAVNEAMLARALNNDQGILQHSYHNLHPMVFQNLGWEVEDMIGVEGWATCKPHILLGCSTMFAKRMQAVWFKTEL